MERKIISFELDGGIYGLFIEDVQEIVVLSPITPLPIAFPDLLGIMNLKGEILAVMDPRPPLGLNKSLPAADSKIIVIRVGNIKVGVLVERVRTLHRVPVELLRKPLEDSEGRSPRYIKCMVNLDEEMVMVIDIERMIRERAGRVEGDV